MICAGVLVEVNGVGWRCAKAAEAAEDLIGFGAVGAGGAGAEVGRGVDRAHFLRDRGGDELIEARVVLAGEPFRLRA